MKNKNQPQPTDQSTTSRSCNTAEADSKVACGTRTASAVPFRVRNEEDKESKFSQPLTSISLYPPGPVGSFNFFNSACRVERPLYLVHFGEAVVESNANDKICSCYVYPVTSFLFILDESRHAPTLHKMFIKTKCRIPLIHSMPVEGCVQRSAMVSPFGHPATHYGQAQLLDQTASVPCR